MSTTTQAWQRQRRVPDDADPSLLPATDPRWVLTMKTSEALQGAVLGPEHRDRLLRLGKTMGLSAFDGNLVIAIVQDQARRGFQPDACPAAGIEQLAMVPPAKTRRTNPRGLHLTVALITLFVAEALILWWVLG